MLSIIIPTLNEEKLLPLLLDSIRRQSVRDYEMIVADAGSKDSTVAIAKRYGCVIVPGGIPAKGRNEGAKIAKGELLLFLDADIALPDDFLEKALQEFSKRKLAIASVLIDSQPWHANFLLWTFYNLPVLLFEPFLSHGAMAILVQSTIYERVGGFDESVKLAEDHYFTRQAAKIGKFGLFHSVRVRTSPRRFTTDGWARTYMKFILCEIYMICKGPVRKDIPVFRHKFNHYKP